MTSRNLICPPLSWRHALRHNRGTSSSISGHSSSSGIHQVSPTSFIRTSPFFLTPHFLPERNLPWHARFLESLSLSFPIILIQLWWSLILLYRGRSVKFSPVCMSFSVCGWIYLHTKDSNLQSVSQVFPLFIHWRIKKGPPSRIMRVYKQFNIHNVLLALHWLQHT